MPLTTVPLAGLSALDASTLLDSAHAPWLLVAVVALVVVIVVKKLLKLLFLVVALAALAVGLHGGLPGALSDVTGGLGGGATHPAPVTQLH